MKCKHIFTALGCALLALSTVGCGAFKGDTQHLQTITLEVSLINGTPPTGQSGFVTLVGNGGTIQLLPMGNYGGGVSKDLTKQVTYTVMVDPFHDVDAFANTLLAPCFGPCPQPFDGIHGTVQWDATGLVTAVEPATCTFVDTAPLDPVTGKPVPPAWSYVGDYVVTASLAGITSQPVYIPVASSTGNPFYGGQENNPNGYCDSGTY